MLVLSTVVCTAGVLLSGWWKWKILVFTIKGNICVTVEHCVKIWLNKTQKHHFRQRIVNILTIYKGVLWTGSYEKVGDNFTLDWCPSILSLSVCLGKWNSAVLLKPSLTFSAYIFSFSVCLSLSILNIMYSIASHRLQCQTQKEIVEATTTRESARRGKSREMAWITVIQ